jgi:enoyl-CoA hydratase
MENILFEKKSHLAVITINRPSKLNALNRQTIDELSIAIDLACNDDEIRVLIFTGSGEKAFVAGADIAEFSDYSALEGTRLSAEGHEKLFDKIEHCNKPCIASINGFALGGGLELAMACHFRTASENAKMGLPEVTLGVIPGYGGTQRLPQLIGKGRAFEMIFTGKMIGAEEAKQVGLVNHVFPQNELLNETLKIAEKITLNSPTAIMHAIAAINAGFEDGVDGYNEEIEAFGRTFGTPDFIEGTSAFLEKRKPLFTGKL